MGREQDILGIIEKPVAVIERELGPGVVVDVAILDECFARVDISLQECFRSHEARDGYDPSVFKVAGVVCFWLRKLKPFRYEAEHASINPRLMINELVAFLVGYHLAYGYAPDEKRPKITATYLHEIICSLRYNAFSPHSLTFLFEAQSLQPASD